MKSHRETADAMAEVYETNRLAAIGTNISCPTCNRQFAKRTYHHVFCSSKKRRRGGSTCKDKYWNITNPRGMVGPKVIDAVFGQRSDFICR